MTQSAAPGEVSSCSTKWSISAAVTVRPALVDLGLLARGRVDHGEVRARLVRDPGEVVEDRLLGELGDSVPVGPPASPVAITGRPSSQRPRDVGPCRRRPCALDGTVALAEAEVRDRDRAIDRGVERHREDHGPSSLGRRLCLPAPMRSLLLSIRSSGVRRLRCDLRRNTATAISITTPTIATTVIGAEATLVALLEECSLVRGASRDKGTVRRRARRSSAAPIRSPRGDRPLDLVGSARDLVALIVPRRIETRSSRSATSGSVVSW